MEKVPGGISWIGKSSSESKNLTRFKGEGGGGGRWSSSRNSTLDSKLAGDGELGPSSFSSDGGWSGIRKESR